MKQVVIQEIEESRPDLFIYRALTKIRAALNAIIGTLVSGTATLAAGTATVYLSRLETSSVILVSRRTSVGTPGHLYVDPASYDLTARSFVISSTSATDTSEVTWLHWN